MPPELWHLWEKNLKRPLEVIIFTDYISILKKKKIKKLKPILQQLLEKVEKESQFLTHSLPLF